MATLRTCAEALLSLPQRAREEARPFQCYSGKSGFREGGPGSAALPRAPSGPDPIDDVREVKDQAHRAPVATAACPQALGGFARLLVSLMG